MRRGKKRNDLGKYIWGLYPRNLRNGGNSQKRDRTRRNNRTCRYAQPRCNSQTQTRARTCRYAQPRTITNSGSNTKSRTSKLFLSSFAVTFFLQEVLQWIFVDLDLIQIGRQVIQQSLAIQLMTVFLLVVVLAVFARLIYAVCSDLKLGQLSTIERWVWLGGIILALLASIGYRVFL